ncbi:MAG: hypothetical protein D6698_09980 [Gammaproteobacteria bacterium]|nr:MAG: hypothetical protein D6698_09980 [Gammaproteobacteria bacterium]
MIIKAQFETGETKVFPASVEHVRPPRRDRTTRIKNYEFNRGCTVMAVQIENYERPLIVASRCNTTDNFSRKQGIDLCLKRLSELLSRRTGKEVKYIWIVGTVQKETSTK